MIDTTAPAANVILPYVDGQAVAFTKNDSGTGQGNFANSQLYFMSRAASSLFGAGDLDEVALYNRALSAATIAGHFGGNAQSPTSSFTATPDPAETGQTVSFNGSASSDPDGTIAKYEWDLDGNGSFETNTGTTADHDPHLRHRRHGDRRPAGDRQRAATPTRRTQSLTVEAPGSGSYASRVLATAGLTTTGGWARPAARPWPTARARLRRRSRARRRSGRPARSPSDTDTSVSFNGTNDAATRHLNLSDDEQADARVLAEVGRSPTTTAWRWSSPRTSTNKPAASWSIPTHPSTAAIRASAIGRGGSRNNAYFARPSAGAWHHYAFVLDTTAPAAEQIIPYVDGQPVAYTKAAQGTGAGNFANSTLYFMSRAGDRPVRRRRPRRGGALQPGAVGAATIADHYSGNGTDTAPDRVVHGQPNPAETGQTVTFDASASSDPDGTIAKYEWDLDGNGTYETDTGTTPTATKTYATAGRSTSACG